MICSPSYTYPHLKIVENLLDSVLYIKLFMNSLITHPLQSKQEVHTTFLAICTIGKLPSPLPEPDSIRTNFFLILFVYGTACQEMLLHVYMLKLIKELTLLP